MSLWLAYQMDEGATSEGVLRRMERVERYHRGVFRFELVRRGCVRPQVGALTWDEEIPAVRWPVWAADGQLGVATAYVPLGWQRVVGEMAPEDAALPLARALLDDPTGVAELAPPFAMAVIEPETERLTILNDGLGFARIYTMRFPGGQVWANRLAALPVFAGVEPQEDVRAWRFMAGVGWFMGASTPLEGAYQLAPGTMVQCRPRERWPVTVRHTGALSRWVTPTGRERPEIDAVAAELVDNARSVAKVWRRPPIVHLSGGRDSRAVAAGVVAAGIDAIFHTVATLEGELTVATRLLSLTEGRYEHRVVEERDVTTTGDLRSRTLALHRAYDGVYGPAGIKQPQLVGLASRAEATLSGAGGEVARGNFYLGGFLELVSRGRDACFDRLDRLYRFHGGVHADVHDQVARGIDDALTRGELLGVTGASLLDYFYLDERLRRWSNASTRLGSVAPLVTPAFFRAGFDCSPEEKQSGLVPVGAIERLVPAWAGVDFYKAGKDDYRGMTRPRMWDTRDRSLLEDLLATPSLWDDVFDPEAVTTIWGQVEAGEGVAKHEMLLQRLAWRAFHREHVAALRDAALD